jgi:hypothetical protein
MDFKRYFYALSPSDREAFAEHAGTSVGYIQCHLITRRKIPRPEKMQRLVAASHGHVTLDDLLTYFYKLPRQGLPLQYPSGGDEQ